MKSRLSRTISTQKIAQWSFFAFLLTATLSLRKILWFMPIRGVFNEYAEISVYASDVFLGVSLGAFAIILYNNNKYKSIFLSQFLRVRATHRPALILITIPPFVLVVWALLSLHYAISVPVGAFFVAKLLEWYGLFLVITIWTVSHGTNVTVSKTKTFQKLLQGVTLVGLFQATLGIFQFIQQKSAGLFLFGESHIAPHMPGVAKVVIANDTLVRAYGTFPHPNILGGFLLFAIISTHLHRKLFHVEQDWFQKWGLYLLGIQYVGIILTFSKSAIVGLTIAWVAARLVPRGISVSRMTCGFSGEGSRRFAVHNGGRNLLIGIGILGALIFFAQVDKDAFLFQSLRERGAYQSMAFDMIQKHPFLGISCGQMVIFLSRQAIYPLFDWQMQPVHNVFLLVWVELGAVGFLIFALWAVLLLSFFQRCQSYSHDDDITRSYLYALFLGFMIPLLMDHYLWDIQQGQIIWWLVTGALSGFILRHELSR